MTEAVALRHDGIVEAPGWFGPAERPLFGWFVYPEIERVRGAVLLCPPTAEESNMAYRTFRALSQQLAAAGFLALRLDYDGTGDSAGSFEDPDRVAAWVASVRAAVAELRRWGVGAVDVVGMRLGATIAHAAAVGGDLGLSRMVLWDPCADGNQFLREGRVLHEKWLEHRERAPEGWVETPSYRFAPPTVGDLKELSIGPEPGIAAQVIVLVRDDRTVPRRLADALPREHSRWEEVSGQAQLLNVATLDARVPRDAVAAVVRAIADARDADARPLVPRAVPRATWSEDGTVVTETARFFGRDGVLFGVETAPTTTRPDSSTALFINVSFERHLGEGRMWVRLARALAASGTASVRMDHSGVGDSGVHPGQPEDVIYADEWLEDVPVVAAELSSDPVPDVVGIGVCSSGSSALEAAARGGLRGAVVINSAFVLEPGDPLLPRWTTFRRRPRVLHTLAREHARLARLVWQVSSIVLPRRGALWPVREAVRRGAEVTMIYGDDDLPQVVNPFWSVGWGRSLQGAPGFALVHEPEADHSLRVSSAQVKVGQHILDRLRPAAALRSDDRAAELVFAPESAPDQPPIRPPQRGYPAVRGLGRMSRSLWEHERREAGQR